MLIKGAWGGWRMPTKGCSGRVFVGFSSCVLCKDNRGERGWMSAAKEGVCKGKGEQHDCSDAVPVWTYIMYIDKTMRERESTNAGGRMS